MSAQTCRSRDALTLIHSYAERESLKDERAARSRARWSRRNLNKRYPYGIGKIGAKDRTGGVPVTNFKRSTKLYELAMSYDRGQIDATRSTKAKQVEVGAVSGTVDQESTMDADLDLLLVSVYCTADDLPPQRPADARRKLTDAEDSPDSRAR